ncbi:hypothetical protein [Paenibacillus wynnii]|uniref:Uncharacterized protein n=1 Tax=Paenibacillus wynnii TaxID=268407 RepID=A0A098MBX4_9BACL|nr:hypothetical protein [Paenibacillus wynnii]KGE20060.1 hypothetical protein PWYN_12460 [Paenibacillus wynnii]
MQGWTASPDKTKPVTITLADGLNQAAEPIEIGEGQAVSVINLDSALYPTLQTREGFTLLSQHTGYINRLCRFKGEWYCGNQRGLYRLTGVVWAAVYDYGNDDNNRLWDVSMFFDGSKLYFIDGSLQLHQWDGATLTALGSAPAGSAFLTTHANRFYLANRNDNLLSFSGLRDAADWTSTDKYTGTGKITVETADGELPTGLTSFSDHVILFKRYTLHELFGEDSTNFTMTAPYPVGCISDRSVVQNRTALYWLGPDGVYEYQGGSSPVRISEPIKDYIESINQANARHCCFGTDGRFLYISLVTGGSQLPNVTLKYDIQGRRWWPCSFVATSYYLDGQTLYMGTADGRILQAGGTTDAGVAINWSIDLKPWSDGAETGRAALHKLTVIAELSSGAVLNIAYAPGLAGGSFTTVRTLVNSDGATQSYRIPVVVHTPETWFRPRIWGSGQVKIHRIIREVTRRKV